MRLKITKSSLIIWIALLVYLKPANAVLWTNVNMCYQILKIIITVIILFKFMRNNKIDKVTLLCLLFLIVWSVSIYLNNGTLGSRMQEILSIFGLICLFKWASNTETQILKTISVIAKIAKIYLILELVTIIINKPLFAEAIVAYDKYFLGSDNYSGFIIIPLVAILCSYSQIKYKKITFVTWLFAFVGFLDLAIPFSVTAMFTYLLMLIIFIFINNPEFRNFFTVKKILILSIVFLGLVIGFNIQSHLSGLLSLIGKIGLNSREIIWPMVVNYILEKPLIGWGKLTENQINSYMLYGADHTHNFLLEIIFDTGIIGGFVMFLLMREILKKIKFYKVKYIYILYASLVCYIVCGMFDFYLSLIYFWLLLFSIDLLKTYAIMNEKQV